MGGGLSAFARPGQEFACDTHGPENPTTSSLLPGFCSAIISRGTLFLIGNVDVANGGRDCVTTLDAPSVGSRAKYNLQSVSFSFCSSDPWTAHKEFRH